MEQSHFLFFFEHSLTDLLSVYFVLDISLGFSDEELSFAFIEVKV